MCKKAVSLFLVIAVLALSSFSWSVSAAELYDISQYLTPLWEGDTVYDESVCILKNADGTFSPISLTYDIDEIISVKDATLRYTYQEGRDYTVEDGKLIISQDTIMPYFSYYEYYPSSGGLDRTDGGKIAFAEGDYFHKKQIVVTYTHSDTWEREIPAAQASKLPGTMSKLENKQPISIVFYGDSITVGANSSQYILSRPYLPIWPKLVTEALKDQYGYDDIIYTNTAQGGVTSTWGAENVSSRVISEGPDLVFVGFGMNDNLLPPDEYAENIRTIINETRSVFEECEFILVATTLPNKEVKDAYANQILYIDELEKIAEELPGVAVADMTTLHDNLLDVKNFRDMTGNNVNHPNDFLARLYAQVALRTLSYEKIPGDITLDGDVSIDDVLVILQTVVQEKTLSGTAFENADMNGDGRVTTTDARLCLRMVAGKEE